MALFEVHLCKDAPQKVPSFRKMALFEMHLWKMALFEVLRKMALFEVHLCIFAIFDASLAFHICVYIYTYMYMCVYIYVYFDASLTFKNLWQTQKGNVEKRFIPYPPIQSWHPSIHEWAMKESHENPVYTNESWISQNLVHLSESDENLIDTNTSCLTCESVKSHT